MANQFIPYELALKAKEKLFDEQCTAFYEMGGEFYNEGYGRYNSSMEFGYAAPTYQQIIDWFETQHGLELIVKSWRYDGKIVWLHSVQKLGHPSTYRFEDKHTGKKYYAESKPEAWNMCINEALERI